LDANHPGYRVLLGQLDSDKIDDREEILTLAGITAEELKNALKEARTIPAAHGEIGGNVFNYLMVLIIKEFIESNRKENDIRILVLFLAIHFYSSLQYKYFKYYNENVMEYAVNSLTNKFILKQQGTIIRMLDAIAWNSHTKYIPLLKKGNDKDIFNYFINLRTRLNGSIKKLKEHYEKVRGDENYINKANKDLFSEEELIDSESGKLLNSVHFITEEFIKGTISNSMLKRALYKDVSLRVMGNVIYSIKSKEKNSNISQLFYLILNGFYEERKVFNIADIRSIGFIAVMIKSFSRKNTVNTGVRKLRVELNLMLLKHCELYKFTKREATKHHYIMTLFKFLLIYVQKTIK